MTVVTLDEALRIAADHYEAGRWAAAEEVYRRILQGHSDQAEAWSGLALVLTTTRRAADAVTACERALALDPDLASAHKTLALARLRQGRVGEAEAACAAALARAPGWPEALAALALVRLAQDRLDESERLFEEALAARPDFAEAWANRASLLARRDRPDDAVASAGRAADLKPHLAATHYLLGILHRRAGRRDAAVAALHRAVDLDPAHADAVTELGDLLRLAGRFDEAAAVLRRGLEHHPDHTGLLANLGTALQAGGDAAGALAAYERVGALDPDIAEVHNNLGLLHRAAGRLDAALAAFARATALKPQGADFHANLAAALLQAGRPAEAEAAARTALGLRPAYPEVRALLGRMLLRAGRLEEAEAVMREAVAPDSGPSAAPPPPPPPAPRRPAPAEAKPDPRADHRPEPAERPARLERGEAAETVVREVIRLHPEDARAHSNLGVLLHGRGQVAEAAACFERAVALDPDYATARSNLGAALFDLGPDRDREALAHLRRAIDLDPRAPGAPGAHVNLARVLRRQGRAAEAVAQLRRALALKPDMAEAYANLGNACQDLGRTEEANTCYRHAIALKPDLAEACANLAGLLAALGRAEEAAVFAGRALAVKPGHAEAWLNLGHARLAQGRTDEAETAYRQALAARPGLAAAQSGLLCALTLHPARSAAEVAAEHRRFGARYTRPPAAPARPHANPRDPDRVLRVGYVSPGFRQHPVGSFIEPVLAGHDRAQVQVFGYAEVACPDAVTRRLRARADHWRPTVGLSDEAVAGMIREDGIDLLVDLAGHTAGNRLGVFALAPAPVQVSWLGYPDTTGLPAIGYRLTDEIADPEDADPEGENRDGGETLVRLPQGFHVYAPPADAPEPAPPPSLAAGHVTFGAFTPVARLHDELAAAWAAILARVPGARLRLKARALADRATARHVAALFAAHGLAPERLELRPWTDTPAEHLRLYAEVDVALDPFPCNGVATTCEALWMGVPVVTRLGDRHAARVGASLLATAGLAELVAADTDAYVDTAVRLGLDVERRVWLRRHLRTRLRLSPLCDGRGFARTLEAAYRRMWRRWCAAGT